MWKCELCGTESSVDIMAIEVRFGYVDEEEANKEGRDQYDAFYTEGAFAPLCDGCAIAYIRGEKV